MNTALHTYVVFQLGLRHIPQTAVAAVAGVTPSMVNQVIRGKKKSDKVQDALVLALGFSSWTELLIASYRFQEIVLGIPKKEA